MTKIPTKIKLHAWGKDTNGDPFNHSVDIIITKIEKKGGIRYNMTYQFPNGQEQDCGDWTKDGLFSGLMKGMVNAYGRGRDEMEHLNLTWFYGEEDV